MKSTDGSTQPDHRPANTSIVYHSFALYRQPIFRTLTDDYEQLGSELTLLSAAETNVPSIQLIDPSLADIPVRDGGFRWEFRLLFPLQVEKQKQVRLFSSSEGFVNVCDCLFNTAL